MPRSNPGIPRENCDKGKPLRRFNRGKIDRNSPDIRIAKGVSLEDLALYPKFSHRPGNHESEPSTATESAVMRSRGLKFWCSGGYGLLRTPTQEIQK